MMLLPSLLTHNFWLKLFSLALAILIWFTIYIVVQQEQRAPLPAAPVLENQTNAPPKNLNE